MIHQVFEFHCDI